MAAKQKSPLNIVMGAMTFGEAGKEGARVHDLKDIEAILDVFQAHGHYEIDTARTYCGGTSEEYLGKINWQKRGLKMDTKLYPNASNTRLQVPGRELISHGPEDLRKYLQIQLKALNTDKLEMWYLHGPDRTTSYDVTMKAINDLYNEGRLFQAIWYQQLRCSAAASLRVDTVNPPKRLRQALDSILARSKDRYWNEPYFKALEIIRKASEEAGFTMAEVALRWVTHHSLMKREFGDSILIGASSLNHIEQNLVDLEKGPLQAATSRLEDLTIAQASSTVPKRDDLPGDKGPSNSFSAPPTAPPPPPPPPAVAQMTEVPESVEAFDENIISTKLKVFVDLTKSFASPVVIEQVGCVESAFKSLRLAILTASACIKPDAKAVNVLLEPLRKDVMTVLQVPEKNRKERVWFNHLQVIAEGIPSVGWIEVEPKPGPHVAQMKESAEFYGNKVIKEFKDKDAKHVEWVRAWISLLEEQRKYVMEFHTTGLAWNPKGVSLSQYSSTAASPGVPPPPPSPATAGAFKPASSGLGAIFADLNRGDDVAKNLRKVDKSEMTHKNPNLRAASTLPGNEISTLKKPIKPSKPVALTGKKPAKFVLEGTKWIIEYQENESGLVVENTEINQSVNLFGCKNSTVQIKGKVNAVTLVNCIKTSVLMHSVIASISVTNSPSFALQITGTAPTIQLDSTDLGQIYLSKECLAVEITTAKCSSINVSLPVEGEEEGVYVERAVPEMLRTTIKDGKLVTAIVEHSG
ncbi:hypothetical protein EW145_g2859 [Phellinidium pouzarii]|uniref:Adenylyl cyclase-associated protein n=1 Tax=Phellinidium pouzarii TaxID=167371 RepID=A0A4V3XD35_9AGAM|nr:hypothetical protein EW145_g2859 [Phellinidium pouzarii]